MPRQPRHGYAADLHHGLRTGDLLPASGVAHHDLLGGRALLTDPCPPGLGPVRRLRGFATGSLSLHLLVSIAGPRPSGSTGLSRRCRGCSRPPSHLQGQAAPIFTSLLRQAHGGVLSSPPGRMAPRGAQSRPRSGPSDSWGGPWPGHAHVVVVRRALARPPRSDGRVPRGQCSQARARCSRVSAGTH